MSVEGEAGAYPRAPRPRRLLGRLTVFILGIALGAGVGAVVAAGYVLAMKPAAVAPAVPQLAGGPATAAAKPAGPAAPVPRIAGGPRSPGPAAFFPTVSPPLAVGRPLVVGVFGDSLADGLWAGLYHQLREDKRFQVIKFSQPSTGLTRYDYVNVQKNTEDQIAGRAIDIAVILFGTNDQQGMIADDAVQPFASPGWRSVYDQRIETLVGTLRQKGIAVYWVGLPRMQREGFDRGASLINQVYADEARALNLPFIPTTPVTEDAQGAYADYLATSAGGRPVLMRAKDGIHMTMEGYLRIAAPVAARLRADVALAEVQHAPAPGAPGAPAVSTVAVTPVSGPAVVSR